MTYVSTGLIQAADYNGFVQNTAGANVNATWNTAYGQTALATVAGPTPGPASIVTAPNQWATLINTISSMAAHQPTTITARTAPTTGTVITALAAVNTDITNCFNNRFNAAANGTQYTAWTGTNSLTGGRAAGAWSITFTNTITFPSAAQASYFFNAGGRIKIDVSKTSTGATGDPEWNDLANTLCGDIFITKGGLTQTIVSVAYTGTTKSGGTGAPNILVTGTGWDSLVAGAAGTIVYKQFADTAPYTSNFIQHTIAKGVSSNTLTITTLWSASDGDPITGGTAATGATPGTAPCTIVTYFPPSTNNLSNTWGTPTVAATTA
jgi:hypothetical protein